MAGNIFFSQAIINVEDKLTAKHFKAIEKKLRADRNKPINSNETGIMVRSVNRRTGEPIFTITNGEQDFTINRKTLNKEARQLLDKIDRNKQWDFPININEITNVKSKNYLAIIHADGNNLGSTIQKIIKKTSNTELAKKLKDLSKLIEKSTISAFTTAFKKIIVKNQNLHYKTNVEKEGKPIIPIRPVILGGDDITLIIRADLAIEFTKEYLKAFNFETNKNLKSLNIDGIKGLTATAGIAFIKEKYPFHYGVHLAESICAYAKNKSGRTYSCMKFYRVQDSFVNSYNNIVENELMVSDDINFDVKPYGLDEIEKLMTKLESLKSEEAPKGAIRKLLTTIYEDKIKAEFLLKRICDNNKGHQKFGIEENIDNNNYLYDLITLDSLTTDN